MDICFSVNSDCSVVIYSLFVSVFVISVIFSPTSPTGLHESVLIQVIDRFQKNNRYDGQTVVFGDEFQKKLGNLKYFLVRKNTSYISVLEVFKLSVMAASFHILLEICSAIFFYVHCIHM